MNLFSVILDIMVVSIVIFVAATSIKRGIISSIIEFVGTVVSITLSVFLGSIAANTIYNQFIQKNIIETLTKAISSNPNNVSEAVFHALPNYAQHGLSTQGINADNIIENSKGTLDIPTSVEMSASTIIISFIAKISIAIIFIILTVIVIKISSNISKKAQLHDLNELNAASSFVSLIFGIIKSLLFLMMIVILIETIVTLMPQADAITKYQEAINSSILYKLFNNINIPLMIINMMT